GLVAPFALTRKLIEVVGPAFARELLFTGRLVGAQRAHEMGLVHYVVSAGQLEATTNTLAKTIADNAPLSLTGMKAGILRATSGGEKIAHDDLDTMVQRARQSADASEGPRAPSGENPAGGPGEWGLRWCGRRRGIGSDALA